MPKTLSPAPKCWGSERALTPTDAISAGTLCNRFRPAVRAGRVRGRVGAKFGRCGNRCDSGAVAPLCPAVVLIGR